MLMEHAERADEAMDVIAAGGGPAGLMTAALLDAAGVRAEACERGSEPTRQSRGTARHPRTLEVLTMIDAGDGRRISDVLLAQGRRVPGHAPRRDARPARLPRPGHAVPVHADAPAVGAEHALAVYLDARGVPVRHGAEVTAAGQSADEAHVEVSGSRHTARDLAGTDGAHNMVRKAAGIGFGRGQPVLAGPHDQHRAAGRRQPAWNGLPCALSARTPMRRGASRPHPAAN